MSLGFDSEDRLDGIQDNHDPNQRNSNLVDRLFDGIDQEINVHQSEQDGYANERTNRPTTVAEKEAEDMFHDGE